MNRSVNPNAYAIMGLAMLASGTRILDLGTVADCEVRHKDDAGNVDGIELRIFGQLEKVRLEGVDAANIWMALSAAATRTTDLPAILTEEDETPQPTLPNIPPPPPAPPFVPQPPLTRTPTPTPPPILTPEPDGGPPPV